MTVKYWTGLGVQKSQSAHLYEVRCRPTGWLVDGALDIFLKTGLLCDCVTLTFWYFFLFSLITGNLFR